MGRSQNCNFLYSPAFNANHSIDKSILGSPGIVCLNELRSGKNIHREPLRLTTFEKLVSIAMLGDKRDCLLNDL